MQRILLVVALLGTAAIARAACDPHPMERFSFYSSHTTNPVPGLEACELRAESTTTATMTCSGRVFHMTWVPQ